MFLGSQIVHNYYKPLNDFNKFLEVELQKLPDDQKKKIMLEKTWCNAQKKMHNKILVT